MAAPAYADSTNQIAELDSSISLALMATVNANDIILIGQGYRGPSSITFNTPTHASLTFTAVAAQSGGAISQQRWYWARAAGGEGGTTVTCTKSSGTAAYHVQAHRFTGCITSGSPIDATSGAWQENTGAGATVTFEAMTLGGDDRLIVVGYFEADDDQSTNINFTTVDVTFTQRFKRLDATGTDTNWTVYTGPNAAGDTSISATSMTQSAADEYSVQQFALLPDTGGLSTISATRAIRYDVLEENSATRAVKYDLRESNEATRAVKYDLLESNESTRAVRYDITGTQSATRAVRYDLLEANEATRAVRYDLLTEVSATRQIRYDAIERNESSRAVIYDLAGLVAAERTIIYDLVGTQASTRDVRYAVGDLTTESSRLGLAWVG